MAKLSKREIYWRNVENALRACNYASSGLCPDCETCRDSVNIDMSMEKFAEDIGNGSLFSEPSFSWSDCDVCGSVLGGDRDVWHYVADDRSFIHCDSVCNDCAMYIANGEFTNQD